MLVGVKSWVQGLWQVRRGGEGNSRKRLRCNSRGSLLRHPGVLLLTLVAACTHPGIRTPTGGPGDELWPQDIVVTPSGGTLLLARGAVFFRAGGSDCWEQRAGIYAQQLVRGRGARLFALHAAPGIHEPPSATLYCTDDEGRSWSEQELDAGFALPDALFRRSLRDPVLFRQDGALLSLANDDACSSAPVQERSIPGSEVLAASSPAFKLGQHGPMLLVVRHGAPAGSSEVFASPDFGRSWSNMGTGLDGVVAASCGEPLCVFISETSVYFTSRSGLEIRSAVDLSHVLSPATQDDLPHRHPVSKRSLVDVHWDGRVARIAVHAYGGHLLREQVGHPSLGELLAVTPDGSTRWLHTPRSQTFKSIVPAADGTVWLLGDTLLRVDGDRVTKEPVLAKRCGS